MAFMIADASTHSDNAEINITPLVDVMLVLLIIFLVAAPVVVRQIELAEPAYRRQRQPEARWRALKPARA